MKPALAISLTTALAALPAAGQTVAPGTVPNLPSLQSLQAEIDAHQAYTVADAWHVYETACGAAIANPGAYLAHHPRVSPQGVKLISRSPDNQIVLMTNYPPWPIWRKITFTGTPGALQILCQVEAGFSSQMTDLARTHAQMETRIAGIHKLFGSMPDTVLVGGELPLLGWLGTMGPVHNSPIEVNPRIFGVQTVLAGKKRFVQIALEGNLLQIEGLYTYRSGAKAGRASGTATAANTPSKPTPAPANAAPKPAAPEPAASGATAEAAMSKAVEICLRNYRTPPQAVTRLRAAGFSLTPGTQNGGWNLSGAGVSGSVVAGPELHCSIRSTRVSLTQARSIGRKLSQSLFPGKVQQGAPEGGDGPCDGQSIFAPRQLIWMRYAQAGAEAGKPVQCIDDGTSAVIIN